MTKDQKILLLFFPLICVVKCIGAIGDVVREIPKELKQTYKYLGTRDQKTGKDQK
jgi:hypothetical protein